jgi:hypothetical protein
MFVFVLIAANANWTSVLYAHSYAFREPVAQLYPVESAWLRSPYFRQRLLHWACLSDRVMLYSLVGFCAAWVMGVWWFMGAWLLWWGVVYALLKRYLYQSYELCTRAQARGWTGWGAHFVEQLKGTLAVLWLVTAFLMPQLRAWTVQAAVEQGWSKVGVGHYLTMVVRSKWRWRVHRKGWWVWVTVSVRRHSEKRRTKKRRSGKRRRR